MIVLNYYLEEILPWILPFPPFLENTLNLLDCQHFCLVKVSRKEQEELQLFIHSFSYHILYATQFKTIPTNILYL